MQNIIEICKEFGIEIPEDKQKDFTAKVTENYTTKAEVEKKIGKLEADRDKWKQDAETAAETLKGFEGKDFDAMQREVDQWKEKAEKAESEYNSKLAEREKEDLLKEAFSKLEFTSESAKKSIMKEISDSISVKNGKLIGFNDLIEEAKKNDASAFVNKEQANLEKNKATFTEKMGGSSSGKMTKADIMAVSDRAERRKLIRENMDLFESTAE